jgi:hypothetical protein
MENLPAVIPSNDVALPPDLVRRPRPHQIASHLPVDPEGQDLGSMA